MECDIIFGIYGEPRGGNRLENNAGLIRAPRAPRPGSCSLQSKHGDEEDHGRGERPRRRIRRKVTHQLESLEKM